MTIKTLVDADREGHDVTDNESRRSSQLKFVITLDAMFLRSETCTAQGHSVKS